MMTDSQQPSARPADGGDEAAARRASAARLAAVQALYQIELSGAPAEAVIRDLLAYPPGDDDGAVFADPDPGIVGRVVRGTLQRSGEVDALIDSALTSSWSLARLEAVLRAILRAGVYEILAESDVGRGVLIDDYVEIAKAFFADKEPGLVNAVLDRLAQRLRADGDDSQAG